MPNVLKFVLLVGGGVFLLLMGGVGIAERLFVTGGALVALGLWLLLSGKVIGPAEMADFVLLGEAIGFRDSGFHFVPFGFARLARYPKKMYNFNYRAREVVTRAAIYDDVSYGAQALRVDAAAYLNFPREHRVHPEKQQEYMRAHGLATEEQFEQAWERMDEDAQEELLEETHPLIKILRAGVPISDKELEGWTEEAVVGALRAAFGRMTWRQAVQDPEAVAREAQEVFRSPDGALIRAGFPKKGVRLVVAEIHLPPELKAALPNVDRQRLAAEAAPFEAKQRAEETAGAVIEAFHSITGMERMAIETALRDNPGAFIDRHRESWTAAWDAIHRRMAIDGRSYLDIRVQGAEGLERGLLSLIGAWQRMPPGGGEAAPRVSQSPREPESFDKGVERFRQRRQ